MNRKVAFTGAVLLFLGSGEAIAWTAKDSKDYQLARTALSSAYKDYASTRYFIEGTVRRTYADTTGDRGIVVEGHACRTATGPSGDGCIRGRFVLTSPVNIFQRTDRDDERDDRTRAYPYGRRYARWQYRDSGHRFGVPAALLLLYEEVFERETRAHGDGVDPETGQRQ